MKYLWVFLACCWFAPAHADDQRYATRATHDPDGIGKFYMGREIAQVMGPSGLFWLERDTRESEERPQLLLKALDLREGSDVADLGAGSGYYTFRLAQQVGPSGHVFAVDVEPRMLNFIRERAQREHATNIEAIEATPNDPRLPQNSVDLVLLVDVYHELAFPYEVMHKVREALRPQGRVVLVEYRAEDPEVMIKPVHKMTEQQIIKEMLAAGFRHLKTDRRLPLQHLVLFQKSDQ